MALSPIGRVSFPQVWTPYTMEDGQTPKFNCTLLWKLEDMSDEQRALFDAMVAAANDAAKGKWGVNLSEEYPAGSGQKLTSPFHKSELKPKYLPPGMIYAKFSSLSKPGVVNGGRDPIDQSSGDFYAGCWAHISYNAYWYDKGGNKGVAFGMKNIQKTDDDEAFGAERSSPDEDFEVRTVPDDQLAF